MIPIELNVLYIWKGSDNGWRVNKRPNSFGKNEVSIIKPLPNILIKKIMLTDNKTVLKLSNSNKRVVNKFPIKNNYSIKVEIKKSRFKKLNDISIKLV